MTAEELKYKITLIKLETDKKIECVRREFVDANNPYKIGDIVTDHKCTIRIEKIRYYLTEKPCAFYSGVILNKDGSPRKDGKTETVYQSQIIN